MRVHRDVIAAVFLIVLALWYGLEAQGFRPGRAGDPGPAMFPLILAGCLIALSLWLLVQGLMKSSKPAPADAASGDTPAAKSLAPYAGLLRAVMAIALTAAFVAFFRPLGYLLAVALYAGLLSLLFRRDSLVVPLTTAAVAVGGIHLLFAVFLNVRLPMGVLS